jgi:hypothetical protein
MDSKHLVRTAYHPQTQGLVEKVDGIHLNEDHSNWDIILPLITFAYKASKSKGTHLFYSNYSMDVNQLSLKI